MKKNQSQYIMNGTTLEFIRIIEGAKLGLFVRGPFSALKQIFYLIKHFGRVSVCVRIFFNIGHSFERGRTTTDLSETLILLLTRRVARKN